MSTLNQVPNSAGSLMAFHTRERVAFSTISFSMRSAVVVAICNVLIAFYHATDGHAIGLLHNLMRNLRSSTSVVAWRPQNHGTGDYPPGSSSPAEDSIEAVSQKLSGTLGS